MAFRRILVAIDASPASLAAAEAAAELAHYLGAELEGMFVRERKLIALAASPLARRLDLVTASVRGFEAGDLEHEMSEQADRARAKFGEIAGRHRVPHRFRVAHGAVEEEIARAAQTVELVCLGTLGWSSRSRSKLGATVRKLLSRRDTHTLVLERWDGIQLPIRILFDDSATALRALDLAARLARAAGQAIDVLLLGEAAGELEEKARTCLADFDVDYRTVPLDGRSASEILRRLAADGHRLLLVPEDLTDLDLGRLLAEVSAPVLLVSR